MGLLKRILGHSNGKTKELPEEVRSVVDTMKREADDVMEILQNRREKNLLEGALGVPRQRDQ
jgi:hypothetical protein